MGYVWANSQSGASVGAHDYIGIVRRSWLLIVIATVAGALIALILSLLSTPIYQAQSQLLRLHGEVHQPGVTNAYSGGLFVQQRVKSYVDVIDSPAVLDPVIQELGLDMTYTQLAPKVSARARRTRVCQRDCYRAPPLRAPRRSPTRLPHPSRRRSRRLEGATPPADDGTTDTTASGTTDSEVPVQAEFGSSSPLRSPGPRYPRTRLNLLLGLLLGRTDRRRHRGAAAHPEHLGEVRGGPRRGRRLHPSRHDHSRARDAGSSPLVTLRGSARAQGLPHHPHQSAVREHRQPPARRGDHLVAAR